MNIVIPLAGKDKNFEARGMIKPLTKVCEKEIIKWIAESRPYPFEDVIFIVLREHQEQYKIADELKRLFGGGVKIVMLDEMTESSVHSILTAESFINNEEDLLIDLGDQYLDLNSFDKIMFKEFMKTNEKKVDGIIPTFKSYYFNRGYMIIGQDGFVERVSEKDRVPISQDSTACISYFKKGSDFVKYARQMIERGHVAANGKYLPSLVYNEMIEDGKKVVTCPCELVAPLGTVQGADCFEQVRRPLGV